MILAPLQSRPHVESPRFGLGFGTHRTVGRLRARRVAWVATLAFGMVMVMVMTMGLTAPWPTAARAQPEAGQMSEAEASRLSGKMAGEIRSPFCPGKSLRSCTSYDAYRLRVDIQDRLLAGASTDDIWSDLVARYGPEVRNPPQPWYTLLLPFIPFVLGFALVIWAFRRVHRRRMAEAGSAPAGSPIDGPDAERLARLRRQIAGDDS